MVAKDVLTEETESLGCVFAQSKEELITKWQLNKGKNIKYVDFYWHPDRGDVLVFIHEVVDEEIVNENMLKEKLFKFYSDCY